MGKSMDTTQSSASDRIRLGVSACLLGEAVRHDGGHKHDRFLTDVLGPYVEWVPVCPEVEIGLGIPRDTVRLVMSGSTAKGHDPTGAQARPLLPEALQLAQLALDLAVHVKGLLSLPDAALVAGDDELAYLLRQLGIGFEAGARRLGEQLRQLALDVDWPLAARALPVGPGLEHLP